MWCRGGRSGLRSRGWVGGGFEGGGKGDEEGDGEMGRWGDGVVLELVYFDTDFRVAVNGMGRGEGGVWLE